MGTWLDRLRGHQSGRIVPASLAVPDGQHVFVLGVEGEHEPALLRDGDYALVRQAVDLTGVDLIEATLETVGVAMSMFEHTLPVLAGGSSAYWPMDVDWPHAENDIQPGPSLLATGSVAAGLESYSAEGSHCRVIPPGTTDSQLVGTNTPQIFTGSIPRYTMRAWVDFDADTIVDSDGTAPNLVSITESGAGLGFTLIGEGGAGPNHKWWPALIHTNGGTTVAVVFTGYPITASTGWHMLTAVYESTAVGVARCKLYVDGVFACNGATVMTIQPAVPSAGAIIRVASPQLVGSIDAVRLMAYEQSGGMVAADYAACIAPVTRNPARWHMQIQIPPDVYCDRVIAEDEHRVWTDFRAPVRHLSGTHTVVFKLWIEEA